jgi:hypothetical protein
VVKCGARPWGLCMRRGVGGKSMSVCAGLSRSYARISNVGLEFPESPITVNERG